MIVFFYRASQDISWCQNPPPSPSWARFAALETKEIFEHESPPPPTSPGKKSCSSAPMNMTLFVNMIFFFLYKGLRTTVITFIIIRLPQLQIGPGKTIGWTKFHSNHNFKCSFNNDFFFKELWEQWFCYIVLSLTLSWSIFRTLKIYYIPHLKNPVIWLVQLSVVVFNHAR